ncbi:MAG: PilN domain-containing protein [Betaproteobacteria bacterium]
MIRINLLAVERERAKRRVTTFQAGQKITVGCGLILLIAVLFVGWRYWTLTRQSNALDAEIAAAQRETSRLHSIIQQVQQFEQRRAQLQQRVALIEQLRKEQTGPVHMLDEVSRSLPPMLWLTELKQSASSPEVTIEGRSTTITGVSDFVANLEASGYFKRSIEIVSSTTEPIQQPPGELVHFTLKAEFQQPGAPARAPAGTTRSGG